MVVRLVYSYKSQLWDDMKRIVWDRLYSTLALSFFDEVNQTNFGA